MAEKKRRSGKELSDPERTLSDLTVADLLSVLGSPQGSENVDPDRRLLDMTLRELGALLSSIAGPAAGSDAQEWDDFWPAAMSTDASWGASGSPEDLFGLADFGAELGGSHPDPWGYGRAYGGGGGEAFGPYGSAYGGDPSKWDLE